MRRAPTHFPRALKYAPDFLASDLPRTSLGTLLGVGLTVGIISCGSDSGTNPAVDPNGVAYSFVVVGCNRVDKADTAGNASTANVAQLNQTFADVAALSPKPNFFFFAGDEVFGYTSDTASLARQLTAWRGLYENSPLASSGVELVAVPGNHEVQDVNKVAYVAAERTWLRVMAPYVAHGGNGPMAGGADNLVTDQSKLSYSFDYKDAHFVALNSDPTGADWHVPTKWLQSDLASARTKGAKHIFVIDHKPAYAYPTVPTDGLSIDPTARDAFWNTLLTNQVEAMFSAHNHMFYRTQPANGKTWMIIAGNGGSKLEASVDATIPGTGVYFGFTLVQVTNGGRVIMKSYGRDVPAPYTAATTRATMRDSTELTWK